MKIREFKYFYPEKPTLIVRDQPLVRKMSDDPNFVAQPKFNEQRCELHLINGTVEFWDRHGKKLDYDTNIRTIKERNQIADYFRKTFGDFGYFLFDCGLRHNKVSDINNKLVVYDIFIYKDELLNKLTYKNRIDILKRFLVSDIDNIVHLVNNHPDNFVEHFERYSNHPSDEFEGLVIKNLNGKFKLGRTSGINSTWMFKIRKETGRHKF